VKYLLDTCAVSEFVKPRPDPGVTAWLAGCEEDDLFLSVLTLGEIQEGIARLTDRARRNALQRWLDTDLRQRFTDRILDVTQDISLTWGMLQGAAELKGRPIPTVDGLLGATAVAHNLTLVTRNTGDFGMTGARLLNPWEA